MIDGADANAMYYAYAFGGLLGNGETGGTARFRSQLLGPLAGKPDPTDEDLREMLRRANKLREEIQLVRTTVCGTTSLLPYVLALCLAVGLAVSPAPVAAAATWTFTPELRRLDAEGNELPAGQTDVERDETLRVGLYVNVSSDGAQPGTKGVLGFESFIGAIHFSSDEMGLSDYCPRHQGATRRSRLGTAHGEHLL